MPLYRIYICFAVSLFMGLGALGDSAEILETKVICQEPGRYIAWPTICRRANGELLVVFSGDRDQHCCPWGKVHLVRSSDNGKTWSVPETIQDTLIDDRDAGIIELKDGSLLLNWFTSIVFYTHFVNYKEAKDPGNRGCLAEYVRHYQSLPKEDVAAHLGYWTARSTDGGRTWSKPVRALAQQPHGMTQLRNGRIVSVARSNDRDLAMPGAPSSARKGHHILFQESTDGGKSWHVVAELQPAKGVTLTDLHEPHMIELADGRLLTQVRWHKNSLPESQAMGLVQAESSDGGRTWTKMTPTPIVGYPPHLLQLADGRVLTVYAKRMPGLFGEYACLSNDGGRTWDVENEICLCKHTNHDLGYPASVQLADGSIFTVYYQSPGNTPYTAIMATHWRAPARKPHRSTTQRTKERKSK